jgi:hypothetical protein
MRRQFPEFQIGKSSLIFFFFFFVTGDCTQNFVHARQTFYHGATYPAELLFCYVINYVRRGYLNKSSLVSGKLEKKLYEEV